MNLVPINGDVIVGKRNGIYVAWIVGYETNEEIRGWSERSPVDAHTSLNISIYYYNERQRRAQEAKDNAERARAKTIEKELRDAEIKKAGGFWKYFFGKKD